MPIARHGHGHGGGSSTLRGSGSLPTAQASPAPAVGSRQRRGSGGALGLRDVSVRGNRGQWGRGLPPPHRSASRWPHRTPTGWPGVGEAGPLQRDLADHLGAADCGCGSLGAGPHESVGVRPVDDRADILLRLRHGPAGSLRQRRGAGPGGSPGGPIDGRFLRGRPHHGLGRGQPGTVAGDLRLLPDRGPHCLRAIHGWDSRHHPVRRSRLDEGRATRSHRLEPDRRGPGPSALSGLRHPQRRHRQGVPAGQVLRGLERDEGVLGPVHQQLECGRLHVALQRCLQRHQGGPPRCVGRRPLRLDGVQCRSLDFIAGHPIRPLGPPGSDVTGRGLLLVGAQDRCRFHCRRRQGVHLGRRVHHRPADLHGEVRRGGQLVDRPDLVAHRMDGVTRASRRT